MEDGSGIVYDKFIQVKMLILFVMRRLPKGVSLELLTELTMCDERINYFDVTECIHKLVKTKHLLLSDGKYSLTAKGSRNGEVLEKDLPHSVKVRADEAVSRINESIKLDALINTRRSADELGGFKVGLSLSDGKGDILSLELYAANEQQADMLEKGFRKNAKELYHSIVDIVVK